MMATRHFNLLVFFLLVAIPSFSQERVPLNRHFFEIESSSEEKLHFTLIENKSPNGEIVVWIFDKENRMIEQSKMGPNPEGTFNQEITERFDSLNNLISQTLMNLDNSRYLTVYYENGTKKAEVFQKEDNSYVIWRENPEAVYTKSYDEFKPSIDAEVLNGFFAKNLTYPLQARRAGAQGIAIVAVLVDAHGEVKEVELANAAQIHPELGKEALRVIKLIEGPFTPALDLKEKPIEAWLYVPVRFKLG